MFKLSLFHLLKVVMVTFLFLELVVAAFSAALFVLDISTTDTDLHTYIHVKKHECSTTAHVHAEMRLACYACTLHSARIQLQYS